MQILREVYHNLANPSTPNDGRAETSLVATRQDEATSREASKLGQASSSDSAAADSWKHVKESEASSSLVTAVDDETSRAARALEQDFAIAVFEIGLRQSSPKVLKGLMLPAESGSLTTEHIKSHLQKYRLHYERSKEEFLGHYRKYLRLDRGDGPLRVGQKRDDAARAPSTTSRDDSTDGDAMRSCSGARVTSRSEREIAQLVRVQSVHNQLVHEQLELQNTLQTQMHEQLHLQAELNALMREAASIPMFGADAENEGSSGKM